MTEPGQPQTVHVNDVDLAYVAQGGGDAVVFVHGSVNDYRSWRSQLAPFAEQYRVVSYSRRYHWPNAQPSEGVSYAAAQHAADLGALIEALGLAPAHVVGSSYGALTALTCAVARPKVVRSLVLGEPPLLPWLARLPDGAALLDAFMATAFEPAAQALAGGKVEAGVRIFIDGVIGPGALDRLPPQARGMMLDNAAAMRAETATPPERYFPALSTDDIGRLPMPVLLVQGEVSPRVFGLITDELARAAGGRAADHPRRLARHARPEPGRLQRGGARLPGQIERVSSGGYAVSQSVGIWWHGHASPPDNASTRSAARTALRSVAKRWSCRCAWPDGSGAALSGGVRGDAADDHDEHGHAAAARAGGGEGGPRSSWGEELTWPLVR